MCSRKLKGATFAYDALHGCGAGWLDRILNDHGIDGSLHPHCTAIHSSTAPDPIHRKKISRR